MKPNLKLPLGVVLCSAQMAKAQTSFPVTDVPKIADYTWAAYIVYLGGFGSGVIVSDSQVLTSASTLNVPPGSDLNVYVGNARQRFGSRYTTNNFQKHPSYNPTTLENNVAIITINGTFMELQTVKPIAMRVSAIVNPISCFSIGWGIRVNSSVTSLLRRVDYQLVTDQECATKLGAQPSTIQCASAMKGNGSFDFGGIDW